jgi:hypothetical protein
MHKRYMRKETAMKKKIKSTKSSGNVFADLGLPDAEEHLVKADMVIAVASLIKSRASLRPRHRN